MIKKIEEMIKTQDGFDIYTLYEVPPKSTGTVIICHGITADLHENGLFDDFSKLFINQSISVLRFDFRGHGKSKGNSLDVTLEGEYSDIAAVYAWMINSSYYNGKYAILGASFSCANIIRQAIKFMPKCLVLFNPVFSYRRTFVVPEASWGKEILNTKNKSDLPASAMAEIPGTEFFISKILWEEMENDRTPELAKNLKCPTRAFHGDKDIKVPIQPIKDFVDTESNIIELEIKKEEGHGLKAHRPELINQISNWISTYLPEE